MPYMPTRETLADVLNTAKVEEKDADLVVVVGSQVYGVAGPESDTDFLVVTREDTPSRLVLFDNMDIVVKGIGDFLDSLDNGSIFSFEGLLAPTEFSLVRRIDYKKPLNESKIKANALDRARSDYKKGVRTENPKKVFHAIRVLDFARQLLQNRYISFQSVYPLYMEVMTVPNLELIRDTYEFYEKRLTHEE